MAAGKHQPSPWEELKNQIYLGSATFANALQARQIPGCDLSEIPASQRRPAPRPLASYEQQYYDRD